MAKKKTPKQLPQVQGKTAPAVAPKKLLTDLRQLIQAAREQTAQAVNSALVLLYWQVGQRIYSEILKKKRADYGEEIVATVSRQLTEEFGRGFTEKGLRRMIQFAELFPDREIVATLSPHLSWSHFVEILPLDEELKRNFYAEMCRIERWSVRTLRQKIGGMLYERTALSKKTDELVQMELSKLREEDRLTPDLVFRDPYLLDFLQLKDSYSEHDLETAILRDIEAFLLELGIGFAFVARQKRMVIDDEDFYLDLLLYHRKLKRLVAIDLKLESFKAADKGQMELYLRWLDKYEREEGEGSPLGLILCAEKKQEQIELLQLDQSSIHVASYLTELPPKKLLQKKLHEAVALARNRLTTKGIADSEKDGG